MASEPDDEVKMTGKVALETSFTLRIEPSPTGSGSLVHLEEYTGPAITQVGALRDILMELGSVRIGLSEHIEHHTGSDDEQIMAVITLYNSGTISVVGDRAIENDETRAEVALAMARAACAMREAKPELIEEGTLQ